MNRVSVDTAGRPPSVDALARELALRHSLPHAVLVDIARRAIANGSLTDVKKLADELAGAKSVARSCQRNRSVIAHEPRPRTGRIANFEPCLKS